MKYSILAVFMFTLTSQAQEPQGETAVRATYTKYELEIPVRDGVKRSVLRCSRGTSSSLSSDKQRRSGNRRGKCARPTRSR